MPKGIVPQVYFAKHDVRDYSVALYLRVMVLNQSTAMMDLNTHVQIY